MTQMRLQKRDDPLAISTPDPPADQSGREKPATPTRASRPARTTTAARRRATRRPAPAAKPSPPAEADHTDHTYDEDRLEQTGWRIYESLLADVRTRAEELSAAGIPTSAAALAAATLHSHLPRTVEDGTEIMRAYRQATAGRQRARRSA